MTVSLPDDRMYMCVWCLCQSAGSRQIYVGVSRQSHLLPSPALPYNNDTDAASPARARKTTQPKQPTGTVRPLTRLRARKHPGCCGGMWCRAPAMAACT